MSITSPLTNFTLSATKTNLKPFLLAEMAGESFQPTLEAKYQSESQSLPVPPSCFQGTTDHSYPLTVPKNWKATADLVFGAIEAPAKDKTLIDSSVRFKVFGV